MTTRMPTPPDARKVIVGVDTHKHVHVAVAIDSWGIRLRDEAFVADSGGYQALITWAETHGRIDAFGIEGTGSDGAGLARAVRRAGHRVVEVNRGDRRTRRAAGKSDTLDAEVAARSVLAGQSTAIPKTADGAVEMMRQLKITRDTAVKARTTAMHTLKQIVVYAPPVLREALHALTDHGLLTRCAGLRPGPIDTLTASAKHTLRALARRWMALTEEIAIHDQHLARLTTETSPTLREGFGVGAHTAAELLIVFGDHPDRIRSEAAFAKLCGACPIPASSGMTTGRHRLNRGGHRHANAALYRAIIVRMRYHQPTVDDVARRTADGRTKREIIRCLKCFLAREIYQRVMTDFRARQEIVQAASTSVLTYRGVNAIPEEAGTGHASDLPALLGYEGESWPARSLGLEAEIRFPWRSGRHPILDCLVETPSALIGIESRRFEPYRPKQASRLSDAYWRPVWGENMTGYESIRDRLRSACEVTHSSVTWTCLPSAKQRVRD